MSNITSKEYLKNLIVRGIKGEKIDQAENEALEREMANFTVGKEVAKEEVDKIIEASDKEIIMESMRLEREKAPVEQRIKTLAPLLTHSLEK
ncbi:13433_t:CDS:2, partial [Funneliformis geosporum]